MTEDVVLALDQGTTSSRTIAFDRSGRVVAVAQREIAQHYPESGWVEAMGVTPLSITPEFTLEFHGVPEPPGRDRRGRAWDQDWITSFERLVLRRFVF